jgi:hypothetical protein
LWGIRGLIGIGWHRKGYLEKIGISFIGKMYWDGGSTKGFLEVFINIQ